MENQKWPACRQRAAIDHDFELKGLVAGSDKLKDALFHPDIRRASRVAHLCEKIDKNRPATVILPLTEHRH